MVNTANRELAAQIVRKGVTQKQLAAEIGMSEKSFYNKINLRPMRNGNISRFTPAEKAWLANRLKMDGRLIN